MRALHHKSGGATDDAQNIILMMIMEKLNPIKIKTCASWNGSGCLYERVGSNQVHL